MVGHPDMEGRVFLLMGVGDQAGHEIDQEVGDTTVALLTAKSLFAGTRLAILHYGFTLTVRTLYGCLCHRLFLLQAVC
jgi:hypothetical protein